MHGPPTRPPSQQRQQSDCDTRAEDHHGPPVAAGEVEFEDNAEERDGGRECVGVEDDAAVEGLALLREGVGDELEGVDFFLPRGGEADVQFGERFFGSRHFAGFEVCGFREAMGNAGMRVEGWYT